MIHCTIRNNVGDTISFGKFKPDFITQNWIQNVFFSFNFTMTTSAQPNMGQVQVFGLDRELRDRIHEIGEPRESSPTEKPLMTWIPNPVDDKDGFIGRYKWKVPTVSLVLDENLNKMDAEETEFTYNQISWSKLEIWSGDDLIYSGDIIEMEEDIDSLTINAGTQFHFLNMLFSEMLYMEDDSEILYWRSNSNNFPSQLNMIQWSPKTYSDIARKIINNWVVDDPFEHCELLDLVKDYDFNKITQKSLEEYRKGREVKDLELQWEIIQYKRLKKDELTKENGENLRSFENYFLTGRISDILIDIAEKGFLTLFCQNDIFHIQSYWVTNNGFGDILLQSYKKPKEEFKYFPVGNVSVDKDGRGVFTSSLKMLLDPSTGVLIYREPDEGHLEMYIDTVEVSGSTDGGIVTYSGRTRDFLWKEMLVPMKIV